MVHDRKGASCAAVAAGRGCVYRLRAQPSAQYADARFDRFNIDGLGQEIQETTTYEPEALLCGNLLENDAAWLELHWKMDNFGTIVQHNVHLRERARALFADNDWFGPLARKLFFPLPRIWKRVEKIYKRHMNRASFARSHALQNGATPALRIAALEVSRPSNVNALRRCVDQEGLRKRAPPPVTTASGDLIAYTTHFFLQPGPYSKARKELQDYIGKERSFYNDQSATAANPDTYTTKYPSGACAIGR